MLKLSDIIKLKKEFGYTNEDMARMSHLPLSTVQKVMSGQIKAPRRHTLEALSDVFLSRIYTDGENFYPNLKYFTDSGADFDIVDNRGVVREEAIKYNTGRTNVTKKKFTKEDYFALPDEARVELINGVFHNLAAPRVKHQRIVLRIAEQIIRCQREHDSECEVLMSPLDVVVEGIGDEEDSVVQPDVMICCDQSIITEDNIVGGPDFVLEVLSDSTRNKDCVEKLEVYRRAGCKEYWIVDPKNGQVIVYTFASAEDMDIRAFTFEDEVPIGISEGKCKVDFREIKKFID